MIWYRTASDTWAWEYSDMPYRYTPAGYIQYDNAGTMTEATQPRWINTYLLQTNISGDARYIIVH